MVRKLIKHEAIRTRSLLGYLFGAATVLALAGALLALTRWPVVGEFGLVVGLVASVGIVPAIQLALGIDYWSSSYRRVGYFTHTLPVKGSTIYFSKLAFASMVVIAAAAWALVLGLITFLGNARAFGMAPFDVFAMVGDFFAAAAAVMPVWGWVAAPMLVLMFLLISLVQYFFCASVGSEKRLGAMGIGGPVVVWVLLYLAMQVALMASMFAIPFGIGMLGDGLGVVSLNFLELMVSNAEPEAMPIGFVPGFVIAAAVLVWRSVVSWNRKVSLA